MDTEYAIYFLLFVLATPYFMYRAGPKEKVDLKEWFQISFFQVENVQLIKI